MDNYVASLYSYSVYQHMQLGSRSVSRMSLNNITTMLLIMTNNSNLLLITHGVVRFSTLFSYYFHTYFLILSFNNNFGHKMLLVVFSTYRYTQIYK